MLKGYKYRLYPNTEQKQLFAQHFGSARHIYNWALDEKDKHYKQTKQNLSRRELQNRLVQMKKTEKVWLSEVNSQTLLAALLNVDTAFKNFFQKRAKFPQRKRKYDGWQSFQCPQHVNVDFDAHKINFPKIKNVDLELHRSFAGKIKTVTIKRSPAHKYFVSILVENEATIPVSSIIEADKTKGIDLGLTHYLIDSEGNKEENPKFLRNSLRQLAVTQRQFARNKKDSRNRSKQKNRVARVHEKITGRRNNYTHQLSAKLAFKSHETSFAIEDLHIKGMIKNHKLARAIADSGWRSFILKLTYKTQWCGKNILTIDRFLASSKICSFCGVRQEKMPLSIREWRCECGVLHDRDINAARNIKQFALADALGRSVCVKQFPCN